MSARALDRFLNVRAAASDLVTLDDLAARLRLSRSDVARAALRAGCERLKLRGILPSAPAASPNPITPIGDR